ncbi:MAG TPA: NEL-type E3 ubiquitin ligase domain-containing protein [Burkholderiales bacterium]|nr:NEL-type E3 ubiquitin ligase domain-containing protein [Burkholderiales bacterium]
MNETNETEELTLERIEENLDAYIARAGDDEHQRAARVRIKALLIPQWRNFLNRRRPNPMEINLSQQDLSEFPPDLHRMTSLKRLYAGVNQFTSIPDEIENLVNLEKLYLFNNQLQVFPSGILKLQRLKHLRISQNPFGNLPERIDQLENLEELWARNTGMSTLPTTIGNLGKLRKLLLANNGLTTLPLTLGLAIQLDEIEVSHNALERLPRELAYLPNFRTLTADHNQLAEVPAWFGRFNEGCSISLTNNQIVSFPESEEMENWPRITIHVQNNPFPDELWARLNAFPEGRGPDLQFALQQGEQVAVQDRPLSQAVERWLAKENPCDPTQEPVTPEQFEAFQNEENAEQFSLVLENLPRSEMYLNFSARPILEAQFAFVLTAIVNNAHARARCFEKAEDGLGHCGDRVQLEASHMYLVCFLSDSLSKDGSLSNRLAIDRRWLIRKFIENECVRIAKDLRIREQVEVHLDGLMTMGKALDTPGAPDVMTYQAFSQMEKEDWEPLIEKIRKIVDGPALVEFLADARQQNTLYTKYREVTTWGEGLKQHCPSLASAEQAFESVKEHLTISWDFENPTFEDVPASQVDLLTSVKNDEDFRLIFLDLEDSQENLMADIKRELTYQYFRQTSRVIDLDEPENDVAESTTQAPAASKESVDIKREIKKCYRHLWLQSYSSRVVAGHQWDADVEHGVIVKAVERNKVTINVLQETIALAPDSINKTVLQAQLSEEEKRLNRFLEKLGPPIRLHDAHERTPMAAHDRQEILQYLGSGQSLASITDYMPALILSKAAQEAINARYEQGAEISRRLPAIPTKVVPFYHANDITLFDDKKGNVFALTTEDLKRSTFTALEIERLPEMSGDNRQGNDVESVSLAFKRTLSSHVKDRLQPHLDAAKLDFESCTLATPVNTPRIANVFTGTVLFKVDSPLGIQFHFLDAQKQKTLIEASNEEIGDKMAAFLTAKLAEGKKTCVTVPIGRGRIKGFQKATAASSSASSAQDKSRKEDTGKSKGAGR